MTTPNTSSDVVERLRSGSPHACQDCSAENPVWFAPSPLWNLVMGGPDTKDDPGGVICPNCFIRRAEAAGVTSTAWLLQPEADSLSQSLARELGEVKKAAVEAESHRALYAKAMFRLKDTLLNVTDDMVEEGDRTYFGSTNDADALHAIALKVDDLHMGELLAHTQPKVNLYDAIESRMAEREEALNRAETAERQLEEAKRLLNLDGADLVTQKWRAEGYRQEAEALQSQLGEAREALRRAGKALDDIWHWYGIGYAKNEGERATSAADPKPLTMLVDAEWLRAKTEADPDLDVEAGSSQALAPLRGGGEEGSSGVEVRGQDPIARPEGEAVPSTREGQR